MRPRRFASRAALSAVDVRPQKLVSEIRFRIRRERISATLNLTFRAALSSPFPLKRGQTSGGDLFLSFS